MKKYIAIALSFLVLLFMVIGCTSSNQTYKDGVYRAEFTNFDSRGYKEFMEVTVTDGTVTKIVYDAIDETGALRTEDIEYAEEMEPIQGTKPSQYSTDLVTQYMVSKNIDDVAAVAGATVSSQNFKKLFTSLEKSMLNGKTEVVLLETTSK